MRRTAGRLGAVVAIVGLLTACGSAGGHVAADAGSTTTSPAPDWVQRAVSRESVASGGPEHGTAQIVRFAARADAVATVMHEDREADDGPPVYVVIERGDFVSSRGHPAGVPAPRGTQLTLVLPQHPTDLTGLDYGLGRDWPLPVGSERFSF